jgi:hypothetical protein
MAAMLKRCSPACRRPDKQAPQRLILRIHSGITPGDMTPGLGFALGAMLCFGASDLIYKRAAVAGIKAGEFLMLQAWIFCPGMTLYAWLTGTLDLHLSALWSGLAGVVLSSLCSISPAACKAARSRPMRQSSG